ncbi:hypothetical protein PDIG_24270 [Penicillium digitatum PHI26]|uniref:SRR1-like domain-containing protein n=3 Tax=Penicillium digitatum TaxID=36651 RepID=K9G178_PEND2|nr:hypothetical protein PDIP_58750 [Penicillium digitatum Pd1]EKV10600.1 hypothetical protein PDIP_58750 [Penicillium digitatum Pd1]EKV15720.1 hypothetical protein PDIG_24270 [Penicillium digitatum PHI26]
MEEAKARIDAWYESGRLFFPKKRIRELGEQLKGLPATGGKIVIEDLNGDTIEGVVPKAEGKFAGMKLGIEYKDARHLKDEIDGCWGVGPLGFSPLQVVYWRYDVLDDETRDHETVVREFGEKIRIWEASEACKKFKSTLSQNVSSHEIDTIVGFACGSLSRPYNPRTDYQHALLMTLKNWLREQAPSKKLHCYIQDPINTSADKKILAEFEFDVVEDPVGWDTVTEQSVVLSIAPNVPVKQIVENIARPAIVIWAAIKDVDRHIIDPDTSRTRKMREHYDVYDLGDEKHLGDAVIYIRKEKVVPVCKSG